MFVNSDDISKAENAVSGGSAPQDLASAEGVLGKGYTGKGKSKQKFSAQIKGMLRGKKKPALFGGGVAGFIIAMFFFIGSLVPYELSHFEKVLHKYESEIVQHIQNRNNNKIWNRFLKSTNGQKESEVAAAEEQVAQDNADAARQGSEPVAGEPVTEGLDQLDISALAPALEQEGYKVKTTSGPNGGVELLDETKGGEDVSETGISALDYGERVDKAVPVFDTEVLTEENPMDTSESGISHSFLDNTHETPDETQEEIAKDVRNEELRMTQEGATTAELAAAPASEDEQSNSSNDAYVEATSGPATAQTGAPESDSKTGDSNIDNAEEEITNQIESGTSPSDALKSVGDGLKSSLTDPTNLSLGFLNDACNIVKVISAAYKAHLVQILDLLARHGGLLLTAASKLQQGKLTGSQVNGLMNGINNNAFDPNSPSDQFYGPKGPVTITDPTHSAAYRRATGEPIVTDPHNVNYTPDITNSSNPKGNTIGNVTQKIKGNTAFSAICTSVNYINTAFIVSQVISIFTLGADEGISVALKEALSALVAAVGQIALSDFITSIVIKELLPYFTTYAISGIENGVQWINNSDAGLNVTNNNYARRTGSIPQAPATAGQIQQKANNEPISTVASGSFGGRLFALSDPYSLVSKIFDNMPWGVASAFSDITNYFTNIPQNLTHSLASIFSPNFAWADANPANSDPGLPYGTIEYATTDKAIGRYDPIANEAYLYSEVQIPCTTTGAPCSVKIPRISMLGDPTGQMNGFNGYNDPNGYVDNVNGDSNANHQCNLYEKQHQGAPMPACFTDLMHCFVDSYDVIMENRTENGKQTGYNAQGSGYTPDLDFNGPGATYANPVVKDSHGQYNNSQHNYPSADMFCGDIGNMETTYMADEPGLKHDMAILDGTATGKLEYIPGNLQIAQIYMYYVNGTQHYVDANGRSYWFFGQAVNTNGYPIDPWGVAENICYPNPGCAPPPHAYANYSSIISQVNDDFNHYRQYLLDLNSVAGLENQVCLPSNKASYCPS